MTLLDTENTIKTLLKSPGASNLILELSINSKPWAPNFLVYRHQVLLFNLHFFTLGSDHLYFLQFSRHAKVVCSLEFCHIAWNIFFWRVCKADLFSSSKVSHIVELPDIFPVTQRHLSFLNSHHLTLCEASMCLHLSTLLSVHYHIPHIGSICLEYSCWGKKSEENTNNMEIVEPLKETILYSSMKSLWTSRSNWEFCWLTQLT